MVKKIEIFQIIIAISDGPLPGILHEVNLPIINNNACEGMYRDAGYIEHIPYIFICAGYREGGKDSCEVINRSQCGNFIIFLSFRFSVKSFLGILEV